VRLDLGALNLWALRVHLFLLKNVTLHLYQTLDILNFEQKVNRDLIKACFFKHTESCLLDILIAYEQEIAEEWKAPAIKV
jgi:hypothetical protein